MGRVRQRNRISNACFSPETVRLCNWISKAQTIKGLWHKDIAVLGQLCAEVIAWCLFPFAKCSCGVNEEDMKQVFSREH